MKIGKYRLYPTIAQDTIKQGYKHCGKCDKDKDVSEFAFRSKTTFKLSVWCRECNRQYDRDNRKRFKNRKLREWYRRVYGVTHKFVIKLLRKQQGLCEICGLTMDEPHLDHDAVTGQVRSLLCHKCNVGLGHFNEDPFLLRKAAAYLERTYEISTPSSSHC